MQSYTFKVGAGLVVDGQRSQIVRMLGDGRVQLESESDGTLVMTNKEELLQQYAQKRVQFIGSNSSTMGCSTLRSTSRALHTFPQEIQNRAIRKKKYLDYVLGRGSFVSTMAVLEPMITDCARQLNDEHPPSVITVWRWYKEFIRHQRDYRAIIDRQDLKGGKGSRLHPDVQEILEDAIDTVYLTEERNFGSEVESKLRYCIDKKNEFRADQEKLVMPSKATLYRVLASLDKYDETHARFGKNIAQMKFRTSRLGVRPKRILERVEIDHTPLDLFVIDETTGLPQGRPTVTMAIDAKSKMPIGMHIGFAGASIEAVFACLRHALVPKTYIKEAYPEIEHDWPCHGRIETLVCDNGLEFHSAQLERVAYELGTQLQFCPKRQAYYKGSIERFLKTLNYQFARSLPGHSFAQWFHREDYDPLKHAVITFQQLMRYLHRWLIDIYAQKLHRGINSSPYRKWSEGVKETPPELLSDLSRLDITLGRTCERTLFHYGIEVHCLRYNDKALLALRRQHGATVKLEVRYYFDDISVIHVIDPITKEAIPVPALDQEYARGLSLEQHRLICRRAREINDDAIDLSALARAKTEIREIVKELSFSKSQRKRQHAAKIQGVGQNKKSSFLSKSVPDDAIATEPAPPPSAKTPVEALPSFGALSFPRPAKSSGAPL
ncbi:hypothetical protein [Collimonas sp.]|jgi:putative transposase|uniref:hypothetical protein n=1 Tax=Collimonas sp. TaxID=1963772 RepID=UPI002C5F1BD6|nr:hypothetical protein [Collimonas sp.]HWW05903.1 hypothetical protein [Collimonas sp.]